MTTGMVSIMLWLRGRFSAENVYSEYVMSAALLTIRMS